MITDQVAFVLDSAVTMAWFFPDGATKEAAANLARLRLSGATVPSLWPLEVANVMLIGEKRGRVTQNDTEAFVTLLRGLPISVKEETPRYAWGEILRLARLHKLTPYDASYLELALRLGLPLATLDKELRQAALDSGVPLL